jgi:hypothetical protein
MPAPPGFFPTDLLTKRVSAGKSGGSNLPLTFVQFHAPGMNSCMSFRQFPYHFEGAGQALGSDQVNGLKLFDI